MDTFVVVLVVGAVIAFVVIRSQNRKRQAEVESVQEVRSVAEGDPVVVLEAMKMEQPLNAHKAGTVTGLTAEVGATVTTGAVICEIKDTDA